MAWAADVAVVTLPNHSLRSANWHLHTYIREREREKESEREEIRGHTQRGVERDTGAQWRGHTHGVDSGEGTHTESIKSVLTFNTTFESA